MTLTLWPGLLLTLVAGLFSGSCMMPMKLAKRWPWENTWLVFTAVSLLILPWTLAFALLHDVVAIYSALPARAFVAPLVFGFGWGIAQVLFPGLSITRLGLALGYAIIVGLGALLGTLVPLLVRNREVLATGRGTLILTGVAIMLLGIAVSAGAGKAREGAAKPVEAARQLFGRAGDGRALRTAGPHVDLCRLPLDKVHCTRGSAARRFTTPWPATPWPRLRCWADSFPTLPIRSGCSHATAHGNTFGEPGTLTSGPAARWEFSGWGAFAIYGAQSLCPPGTLGTSVGWALFQIFMIITANLSGVLTGEWRHAHRAARRGLAMGLALLAAATIVIAAGNR